MRMLGGLEGSPIANAFAEARDAVRLSASNEKRAMASPSQKSIRFNLKRWLPGLLTASTVVLAVVGAALHVSVSKSEPARRESAGAAAVLTVESVPVRTRDWPQVVAANGNIAPWQEAVVAAAVGGLRITDVLVDVGDTVKRGQPLARFDQATLRSDVAALAADEMQAKAAASRATAEFARAKELHASDGISEQDLLRDRTQAETTQAQLAAAQARLKTREIQLEQADVTAPDDGVITSRSVSLGAVEPAGQELFRLIRRSRLQWQGELSEKQLSIVRAGQAVRIDLPDGTQALASVSHLDPRISTVTRLGLVYADINSGSNARAGMFASARIELASAPAHVVPAASVINRDGLSVAAVLVRGNAQVTVDLRHVTTGRQVGNEVEILSGLRDGDEVVARGAAFLSQGDAVLIAPSRQKPSAQGWPT